MEKPNKKLGDNLFSEGNTDSLKYKEEYVNKADGYIKLCKDRNVRFLKMRNNEKGYTSYETKLKVSLPTVEGFAKYLGVVRNTLYNWAKSYPKFKIALNKVVSEQKQRLIDCGLSGSYNSTIAKLILSSNHGMKERVDKTSDDEPINNFNDKQIDRIAERIANRRANDGDTPSEEKSD